VPRRVIRGELPMTGCWELLAIIARGAVGLGVGLFWLFVLHLLSSERPGVRKAAAKRWEKRHG
jgi:hypothetical protein